jgi:hypothetical protein
MTMLSKCVFLSFHLLKQATDFNKSSYEHYAIEGNSKFCTFYFPFMGNNNMVNKWSSAWDKYVTNVIKLVKMMKQHQFNRETQIP